MEVIIQGILLQTRTIDKTIKICPTTAQTLRPLGDYATDVVYEKRIMKPSENSPFLKWLRICILQKLDETSIAGRDVFEPFVSLRPVMMKSE